LEVKDIIMLMTESALKQFQVNKEWAAGVGVNIALANSGGCVLIKKSFPADPSFF